MPLRSPPGAADRNAASPKLLDRGAAADMPARSPKLLRSNSSKKVAAASSLERAILSFKTWEPDATDAAACAAARAPAADHAAPPSPVRRIHGARPGRLALGPQSPLAAARRQPPEQGARSPLHEAAATTVQKMFKGHRTRRSLADGAIIAEELWWKAYDSVYLNIKSISFFDGDKQETAASRWSRAGKRIAKVGKGLSKDDKAQKLALQHWLEAVSVHSSCSCLFLTATNFFLDWIGLDWMKKMFLICLCCFFFLNSIIRLTRATATATASTSTTTSGPPVPAASPSSTGWTSAPGETCITPSAQEPSFTRSSSCTSARYVHPF